MLAYIESLNILGLSKVLQCVLLACNGPTGVQRYQLPLP